MEAIELANRTTTADDEMAKGVTPTVKPFANKGGYDYVA